VQRSLGVATKDWLHTLGLWGHEIQGGSMRRTLLILFACLFVLTSGTSLTAAQSPVAPTAIPATHGAGTVTTVSPTPRTTPAPTTTTAATASAPIAIAPQPGGRATAPSAVGTIVAKPGAASVTPSATGTAKATATIKASATGTAKPAAALGITPNVVTTPNTAIGEQRFQTFVRQRITDRQDLAVNVANGNLVVHGREMNITGTGLNLAFDRFSNSQSTLTETLLGTGSTLGTGPDVKVQENADGSVLYFGPSGYQVTFAKSGTTYTTPNALDATLTKPGGTFLLAFHQSGEKYAFNTSGALATITDRNTNAITFAYNADGTVSGITDTQGRAFTFQYGIQDNGAKRIDYIRDPNQPGNNVIQYLYFQNRLSGVNNAAGENTSYLYNAAGLVSQINDPRGNQILFTYDASSRVQTITRVTDHATNTGPTTTFAYNSGNTVVTNANTQPTTYTYDSMGRVTQTLDASNHTRGASYNGDSNVLTYTDSAAKVTNFTWGANNGESMTQMQMPTGATTKMAYTDTVNPFSPTSSTDPQGKTSNYVYDGSGNQMSGADPLMNTTHATYNSNNGTIATTTDALGRVTTYGYDTGNKNVTSITPPPMSTLGTVTIRYDTDSRITQITDGKGNVENLSYDASDRRRNIDYVGGPSLFYGVDANGNITTANDPNGSQTYTYDALNRQLTKSFPGTGSPFTYTYDGVGNLASLQDTSGITGYSYDATNLLTALFEPGQSGGTAHTTFAYNTNGNRTGTTYPNGVTLAQRYDDSGRTIGISGSKSGVTGLPNSSYTYAIPGPQPGLPATDTGHVLNSQNNLTGVVTTYNYDNANRLTGAVNSTQNNQYTYDGAGNRLTATLNGTSTFTSPVYNAANELTGVNGTTLGYDANGNETGRSAGLTGFTYNPANQTTSITPQGVSAVPLTYAGQTQDSRNTKGGTSYANSLLGVLSETTGGTTTYYVRDNGGRLVGERIGTNSYYYLFDGLGSVVALTDSTGAAVDTYSYDPYGNVTSSTGSVANPWQYTGGYRDSETGLVKLGQRYYDPTLGRWTQLDPLGDGYVYTSDNPINFIDPSGLDDRPLSQRAQELGASEFHLGVEIAALGAALATGGSVGCGPCAAVGTTVALGGAAIAGGGAATNIFGRLAGLFGD